MDQVRLWMPGTKSAQGRVQQHSPLLWGDVKANASDGFKNWLANSTKPY